MKRTMRYLTTLLVVLSLLITMANSVFADGHCPMSDWSEWDSYFTPIIPAQHDLGIAPNPAERPIPTKAPKDAWLQAWVNAIPSLPAPALAAHAEEVARGDDHSTIIGHGPAKSEWASVNAWATGGVLRDDKNPGPFFETFDDFYGQTWRMIPHLWGAYAYQGAEWVTIDREQVHKDEAPYDGDSYSVKVAASVPFEAGISREIRVTPGAEVKVRVMYALYDHGGEHGGNVWTYDWAALGVKADDCDAEWVNGPWHGEWLPLEHTVTAGPEGRIMIFLQVISPLPENVNCYFDNVQVWVDGVPFTG